MPCGRKGGPVIKRLRAVLLVAALTAAVALGGIAVYHLTGRGVWDIHDLATLPARISVCGRDWQIGSAPPTLLAGFQPDGFRAPVVVDPGPFAPCPSGPCTASGDNPCDTVVSVRVSAYTYVRYALVGGP